VLALEQNGREVVWAAGDDPPLPLDPQERLVENTQEQRPAKWTRVQIQLNARRRMPVIDDYQDWRPRRFHSSALRTAGRFRKGAKRQFNASLQIGDGVVRSRKCRREAQYV
jgi:hypothetical protein